MEMILFYGSTVIWSCVLGLILTFRLKRNYNYFRGKDFYHFALIIFTLIIPIVNVITMILYNIFLFGKHEGYKHRNTRGENY